MNLHAQLKFICHKIRYAAIDCSVNSGLDISYFASSVEIFTHSITVKIGCKLHMPYSETVDAPIFGLCRLEQGAGLLYRCLGFKTGPLNAYCGWNMDVKDLVLDAKL